MSGEFQGAYFDGGGGHVPLGRNVLHGDFKFATVAWCDRGRGRGEDGSCFALGDLILLIVKLDGKGDAGEWAIAGVYDLSGDGSHFLMQEIFRAGHFKVFDGNVRSVEALFGAERIERFRRWGSRG